MGDRDKLHQAFLNIILNGIQSMAGGDTLTIDAQWVRNLKHEHAEIQIVVRDTGPGIPENLQPKIFEPFFTAKRDGTGLGLAITKKIIEAHQGRIEVAANSPRGAVFIVSIPAGVFPTVEKKE